MASESTWKHEARCTERHNSFIQSYTEQKWHSAHLQKHCLNSLSQTVYLRTFAPNYLTLHTHKIHYYFPANVFGLGMSPIKRSSPSCHLVKWCPFLETHTKAILSLITAVWNDLPIFLIPTMFAIHASSQSGSKTAGFKNVPWSVFLQILEKAVAIFRVFTNLFCHS